jgi:hypothetical protein
MLVSGTGLTPEPIKPEERAFSTQWKMWHPESQQLHTLCLENWEMCDRHNKILLQQPAYDDARPVWLEKESRLYEPVKTGLSHSWSPDCAQTPCMIIKPSFQCMALTQTQNKPYSKDPGNVKCYTLLNGKQLRLQLPASISLYC